MQDYFSLLHEGDVDAIREMFLPTCDLSCAMDDGSVAHMTLDQYVDAVSSRTSPRDQGYSRVGRIVSIDQSGPSTALAKVDCAVQPRHFTDYLTLIKESGRWRIAAKVYYVRDLEDQA